jgi:1-deoxy-D-xylulose-5-phosphate reductoisomerase
MVLTGVTSCPPGIDYLGPSGLIQGIAESKGHIAVNGIAGAAGLEPSIAALQSGMDLALANKETIVMAGELVLRLAEENRCRIIPVDSEHAAIFTLLEAHKKKNIAEIILTASGGPFRNYSLEQIKSVTPEEALAHPTWNMGTKITIDSATMANKGLELIEAARLFNLPASNIKVVIHPQSIVHSMIRCEDGAVYAQMSCPDMRLPIQNALFYPKTGKPLIEPLNFDHLTLEFFKPDEEKFPLLYIARKLYQESPLRSAAYNAANEVAVGAFLKRKIRFYDIARVVEEAVYAACTGNGSLAAILKTDHEARKLAERSINSLCT